jgi:hypothetical protein
MGRSENQAITDAYLAVEAGKKVMFGTIEQYEAVLLTGSRTEIDRWRAAVHSCLEALLDRKDELVWAQMVRDGIDPRTRKLF